jgi:hypothetical protein
MSHDHEKSMRELDVEGIRELFVACQEYHQKHSRGPGGSAMCVCGFGCGGSKACRGLALVRDFFRHNDPESPEFSTRFAAMKSILQ